MKIILFLFLLVSSGIVFGKQIKKPHAVMGCYYLMNDKYCQTTNADTITKWINEQIVEIENRGIGQNIFTGNAGGPNGAEWNPSASLWVAVVIDTLVRDDDYMVYLNRRYISDIRIYTKTDSINNKSIVWFIIPKKIWFSKLRPIRDTDLIDLFGSNNKDTLAEKLSADASVGEIVEVGLYFSRITSSTYSFTEYFYAAFGE